jgi:ABC-type lipoprotein export system ATPase subunit
MDTKIGKISKVEIKSLWNRFDLEWNLHPDVNILSGINGSGKSTILGCMTSFLRIGNDIPFNHLVQSVKITFENGRSISSGITSFDDLKITPDELHQLVEIDIISTFDNVITEIGKRPDEHVRTELDRDIFSLQKRYLDYQLNIGKKAFEIVTQNNGSSQGEVLQIRKQQDRFLEIIDNLFKDTGKRINRDKNEITFVCGDEELTAYQLSSGEKQMLVILLTVLVQDNKPSIIFMDEPEISLHFDWQKKLIQFIQELNPNVQIILATHSPAVIMEGWRDKVADVKDLIVNDKTNLPE